MKVEASLFPCSESHYDSKPEYKIILSFSEDGQIVDHIISRYNAEELIKQLNRLLNA